MSTRATGDRRRGPSGVVGAVACALAVGLLAGCVADPPPPTVVGEERSDGEAVRRSADGVLLALDRVDEGFNPHLVSDQGADTDLVASLLLPSAFRTGPDGEYVPDPDLLESAAPLPDAPDTIRYTIRQKAQWSDGVPVAAEDFEYLWRQMTTQPGVVDPAGYERITAVRPGAGGKVVDVVFDSLPADWRSLFRHLLPGHLLKDAPDGFQGAMARPPVTSGGPFMIRTADLGRGEVEFVRNDRYWADAPALDQILVRRVTGPGQLGTALRSGPGAVSLVTDTPVAVDVADTVPGVVFREVDAAVQLELAFNTVAPVAADRSVRRAVTAALRPQTIGRIVTGSSDPGTTSFPFPAGTGMATTGTPAAVPGLLGDAGYRRAGDRWELDGAPLSITLGVEADDDRAVTAAYSVADQARAAGIGARVWELDPVALYADALPHGLVDAVVGWQRVDGDAANAAVSRFACSSSSPAGTDPTGTPRPSRAATTVSSLVPPEPDTGRTSTPGTSPSPTPTPSTPPRTVGADAPARASGVSGVCDGEVDRALGLGPSTGGADTPDPRPPDLRAAGELVAERALRVPLVRPGFLFAGDTGSGAFGRTEPGPGGTPDAADRPRVVTDVFESAPTWRRNG